MEKRVKITVSEFDKWGLGKSDRAFWTYGLVLLSRQATKEFQGIKWDPDIETILLNEKDSKKVSLAILKLFYLGEK